MRLSYILGLPFGEVATEQEVKCITGWWNKKFRISYNCLKLMDWKGFIQRPDAREFLSLFTFCFASSLQQKKLVLTLKIVYSKKHVNDSEPVRLNLMFSRFFLNIKTKSVIDRKIKIWVGLFSIFEVVNPTFRHRHLSIC